MKIGPGVRISLVNIRPGQDDAAKDYLLQHGHGQIHVHWLLGPFDLLVFSPLQDTLKEDLGLRPLLPPDHSVGSFSLQTFKVETTNLDDLESVVTSEIVLVSSLKISIEWLRQAGLQAEDALARFIDSRIGELRTGSDTKVSILGGLGWYELVLVLGGRDLAEMTEIVVRLRRLTANEVVPGAPSGPALETSFTIAGFSPEWAARARTHSASSEETVVARITLVCRPGRVGSVRALAKEIFGDEVERRNPLGKGEIVVAIEKPFSEIARALFRFRREAGDLLRETETAIERNIDATRTWSDAEPDRASERDIIETSIETSDLADLATTDPYLHDKLQQVLFTFNGRMADDVFGDAFKDTVPFIRRLTSRTTFTEDDGITHRALSEVCDLYLEGMTQRYAGSYLSFLSPNTLVNVRDESGVHRLLVAAESVINAIVVRTGSEWSGFSIFGLHNGFRRLEFGVVNVPWPCLLRPEDWWQLFHEAGHEYLEALRILQSDEFQKLLEVYLGIPREVFGREDSATEYHDVITFLWDLSADFVDYLLGFNAQWGEYARVTWGHLATTAGSNERGTVFQQLVRAFLVWAVVERQGDVAEQLISEDAFSSIWSDYLNAIRQFLPPALDMSAIQQVHRNSMLEAFGHVVDWFEVAGWLGKRLSYLSDLGIQGGSEEMASVLRGEPTASISDPVDFLRRFAVAAASGVPISFEQRVAAVLSLWSAQVRRLPGRRSYSVIF